MDEAPLHAPSVTTLEEDLHTAGQRRVNITWEYTQSFVAVAVVIANIIGALYTGVDSPLLANAFFLVIGFYFGRTNHARVGGVQLGR
jgi:hypothetical protein